MQFTTAILATLSFAGSTYAWAQAADGTWVANNNWYNLKYHGFDTLVHESCTYRNTVNVHNASPQQAVGDKCAFWINDRGDMYHGNCHYYDGVMSCECDLPGGGGC